MSQAPATVQWKDFLCGSAEEAERRVKAQIAIGVSPLATSKYGKTLLHAAAIANNLPVARLAIASGVAIDQRAYPNGKRYQKRTLGWTALFYAVRNSTIDVTRFLLDNGAAEVRSVQGETPIEAALSARAEDSFWLLIEYGFSDMDKVNKDYSKLSADTRHSIHRNIPPSIISSQFAWTKMPVELIGFLEKFLQSALGVTVNQTEYTEFCSRCSSGLKSCDDKIREVWRERNERISMWKPFSESFDYGYLRRCQICRTSLTKTRSQSPGSLLNVPTMILPSDTPAFSFVQKRNFEEDLFNILKLTNSHRSRRQNSHDSFLLSPYWLLRCLKNHRECGLEAENPILPKRVIEVGDSDKRGTTRLLECQEGQRGTYCALSYRWASNPVMLLKENIASFKEEIFVTELPRTIQDAITIARRLGFKYLWVDSLCILQDSYADWEEQAGQMGNIYFRSTLTIAAVDAREDGIYESCRSHSPWWADSFDEEMTPHRDPFDERRSRHRDPFDEKRSRQGGWRPRGILDSRGWAAQEQVLSRRILSFTTRGVFWSCAKWDCSEKLPAGIPGQCPSAEQFCRRAYKWAVDPARDEGYKIWNGIVVDYTHRDLTKDSDRLIAIKGLGSFFSLRLEDKLFAGIWRNNWHRDLAWFCPTLRFPVQPKSYTAPSWSWGSQTLPVKYVPEDRDGIVKNLALIELRDILVEDLGNGSFSGSITFKGTLIPIYFNGGKVCLTPSTVPAKGAFWRADDGTFFCMKGEGFALNMGGYAIGLVPLVGKPNTFKRVGLCEWDADLVRELAGKYGHLLGVDKERFDYEGLKTVIIE